MSQDGVSKKGIVNRILDIEVKMFLRVPTGEEPACRADIENMRLHRRGQFAGWSVETCESYLHDLETAEASGKNLLTLKYARMDKRIPSLSESPDISHIRDCYVEWQKLIISRYPNVMRGARDIAGFSNYLSSELETYSNQTLILLRSDVDDCRQTGGNMSLAVYESLAGQSGYASLDDMEKSLK